MTLTEEFKKVALQAEQADLEFHQALTATFVAEQKFLGLHRRANDLYLLIKQEREKEKK